MPVKVIQHFSGQPVPGRKTKDRRSQRVFPNPVLDALESEEALAGQDRIQWLKDFDVTVKINSPHLVNPFPAQVIGGKTEIAFFHLPGDESVTQRQVVPRPFKQLEITQMRFPGPPVSPKAFRQWLAIQPNGVEEFRNS